jgi:hypothetical protein
MTCPICGRYAPADPNTGYDRDEICPDHTKKEIEEWIDFEEDELGVLKDVDPGDEDEDPSL